MVSSHEFASFFISNIVLGDGTDSTGEFFTSVPPLTVLYLELTLFISSLPVPNHNASRGHGNTQLVVIKSHFFLIGS